MAASSSSSAVTPSDTTAGPVAGDAFRRILDSAIEAAPSKLLVSALAEKMTDAQLEELNEAKKRRERKPTSFDDLPDEIVVKIFQMASTKPVWFAEKYNHGFIVRVLSKVSIRFRQLATNYSLWKGVVVIDRCYWPTGFNTSEWEYVVQECLNNGTRRFVLLGVHPSSTPLTLHSTYVPYMMMSALTQRSSMDSDHHQNVRLGLINSGYALDMGGPQKRNFRSGSPRTFTCAPWKNLSNLPYL